MEQKNRGGTKMIECQDCSEKIGDTLIFSDYKKDFFIVCRDCIEKEDYYGTWKDPDITALGSPECQ